MAGKAIIGLCGYAGAGKSTSAHILSDRLGCSVIPFAAPIKRMALHYGLTRNEVSHDKERPFSRALPVINEGVARHMLGMWGLGVPLNSMTFNSHKGTDLLCGRSVDYAIESLIEWHKTYKDKITNPRQFLQKLGTEWGRDMMHYDLWVRVWKHELQEEYMLEGQTMFVTDDCRFVNEADAIKKMSGIIIEIIRADVKSKIGSEHPSEKGLPQHLIDFRIKNVGTEKDLAEALLCVTSTAFESQFSFVG